PTATRTFIKDTLAPIGNSIIIGDGITPPTSPNVLLHLTSTGATTMYITNTAGCLVGGTTVPYATTMNWTLAPVGNIATVFVRFGDDAGNTSPCISASITTDFAPPPMVAIVSPPSG